MRKKLLGGAFVILGTLLSACAVHVGYAARYGPPPPRYGVVGVAPGPGYIWTDGFWDWRGGNYVWVTGRWMRPPHARAVWVPGGWAQEHGAYRFHRGYWR